MVFENRLAKIGKGNNANLCINSDDKISIILYVNSCTEKMLDTTHEKYNLITTENNYPYHELIKIDDTIAVSRLGNNIRIINIK